MTEQAEASPDATSVSDLPPELEIEFMGRKIWVRMISPEQLLVWKRILRRLQEVETETWNLDQVMISLERVRKIIDTIIVRREDVEWLDDQMLDQKANLTEMAQIIHKTVEAYANAVEAEKAEHGTRVERRAATKTGKKAVRKSPRKKADK